MQIRDVMTKNPVSIAHDAALKDAAAIMAQEDIGSLPVTDSERLVGVITDLDIVIRAIARGESATSKVSAAMTRDVVTCSPDTDVQAATRMMGDRQIRRLYIVDGGALRGVVALGDLAKEAPAGDAAKALKEISED